jgi:hypothetical protein
VALLIEVSEAEQPPLHLFLGRDSYDLAGQQIAAVQQDLLRWEAQATATDFSVA